MRGVEKMPNPRIRVNDFQRERGALPSDVAIQPRALESGKTLLAR
jgi:hypothetical protein